MLSKMLTAWQTVIPLAGAPKNYLTGISYLSWAAV
jgi:hypothetical protein